MKVYYGSKTVVSHPTHNGSKKENDYGPAFYLTRDLVSAHEWACRNGTIGFVNIYQQEVPTSLSGGSMSPMEITFEALFYLIPIHDMLNQYHLYHEMDYKQILDYANEQIKCSILNVVMKRKKVSSNELSHSTGLSFATINSLRYGKRDITKLAGDKLLLLSRALNVKMETLLPQIHLIKM